LRLSKHTADPIATAPAAVTNRTERLCSFMVVSPKPNRHAAAGHDYVTESAADLTTRHEPWNL
jgi:hypothetical protein